MVEYTRQVARSRGRNVIGRVVVESQVTLAGERVAAVNSAVKKLHA